MINPRNNQNPYGVFDTMLCSICQNIVFHATDHFGDGELLPHSTFKATKNGPFFSAHHPSLRALESSAGKGCNFCVQILFSFDRADLRKLRLRPDALIWLHYRLLGHSRLPRAICVSCDGCQGYVNVLASDPIADPHTGSQQNISLAKAWLNECINQHSECQPHQSGHYTLPTRVLDVSNQRIHLLETHTMYDEYAILSHCWGSKPIITTKLQDIAARCKNIDFSTLSKTFQEAVIVTRSLGLKYLWIDSLCIIQDSGKDWEIESSKMGTYYACARICIAANAASEGSIGCFFERHPATVQWIPLSIALSDAQNPTLILTQPVKRSDEMNLTSAGFVHRGWREQLESRAWALQETILAKRMLKFNRYQLEWACERKYASERDPLGNPAPVATETDCFKSLTILDSQISRFGPLSRHNIWYDIVEQYTERELTYGTDMLPALSGIATRYQEMTTDVYLAGLWKSDLARGLLWRTPNLRHLQGESLNSRKMREASRPAVYRAPSWSWASIDAAYINWDLISDWGSIDGHTVAAELADESKHGESCYRLLDANTSLAGFGKFGRVSGGTLTIQGIIMSAEVWAFQEGTGRQHFEDNICEKISDEPELIGRFDPDKTGYEPSRIFVLPIVRPKQLTHTATAEEVEERVLCLALEVIDQQKGIYTRVGTATIRNWGFFESLSATELTIL